MPMHTHAEVLTYPGSKQWHQMGAYKNERARMLPCVILNVNDVRIVALSLSTILILVVS